MHVRFSTARGQPVTDPLTEESAGVLEDVLLNPDTGTVEGFFVRVPGFFHSEQLFLASADIAHWGVRVRVRSADVLFRLEDHVRLQALFDEGRRMLHQRIVTESGTVLGQCGDIQFDTKLFRLEWLFPRRWFRWGTPIPLSSILRVTKEAVIVRDPTLSMPTVTAAEALVQTLEPLGGTAQCHAECPP